MLPDVPGHLSRENEQSRECREVQWVIREQCDRKHDNGDGHYEKRSIGGPNKKVGEVTREFMMVKNSQKRLGGKVVIRKKNRYEIKRMS